MRHTLALMLAAMLYPGIVVAQVEIPEGFEIVEITRSDYFTGFPTINNCGQIAFDQQLGPDFSSKEIFLYDNGQIRRITDDEVSDRLCAINDAETLVWMRNARPDDTQVAYYENGVMTILDKRRYGLSGVAINNLAYVAWSRFRESICPLAQDLVVWDGVNITRITPKDDFNDQSPDLNDHGWVVWGHSYNCVRPWVGDIRLWSEGKTIVLPSSQTQVSTPTVNDALQIAWNAGQGIEFWENGQTVLFTEHGGGPSLNNLGDMYFYRWDEGIRVWQPWVYRVSHGEPRFYRLVDDPKAVHTVGDINDWAEAAWDWHRPGGNLSGGMLFLRRIRTGDSQFDGDIDLVDYGAFANCMTGPGRVDRLCDCRFLDIDHDGDVDLDDFALFQNAFEGN